MKPFQNRRMSDLWCQAKAALNATIGGDRRTTQDQAEKLPTTPTASPVATERLMMCSLLQIVFNYGPVRSWKSLCGLAYYKLNILVTMTTAQSKCTDKLWMLKYRLDRGVEMIRHVGSHKEKVWSNYRMKKSYRWDIINSCCRGFMTGTSFYINIQRVIREQ